MFVKRGVELSKQNGSVSVKLNVKEVWDYELNQVVYSPMSNSSNGAHNSAPDKDILEDHGKSNQAQTIKNIFFEMIFIDIRCGVCLEDFQKICMSDAQLKDCQMIINNLGGSIEIKSELGKGTQFIISFQT